MAKIIDFNQTLINFEDFYSKELLNHFYNSKLGRLYSNIPWQVLVRFYSQRDNQRKKKPGRPRKLPIRSELAILILQAYTGLSAEKLWEQIIQNVFYQYFIGVRILPILVRKYDHHIIYRLKDYYSLEENEIKQLQKQLAAYWRQYLPDRDGMMVDATVFEGDVSWPVMATLLDSVLSKLRRRVVYYGHQLGKRVGTKRAERLHNQYSQLIKKRRKSRQKTRQLEKKQLKLAKEYLEKLKVFISQLEAKGEAVSEKEKRFLDLLSKVLEQQERRLSGEKISHLIISLYSHYYHKIYRGKVRKRFEIGLKYHLLYRGGLLWIEHYSNKNYNEGARFKEAIEYSLELFGSYPRYISADRLYHTRENRQYLKQLGIKSNFPPVGRVKSGDKEAYEQLVSELSRARNQIEGIFGVLKRNYYTERIRYKSKESNVLLVFLSILIYNSFKISGYRLNSERRKQTA